MVTCLARSVDLAFNLMPFGKASFSPSLVKEGVFSVAHTCTDINNNSGWLGWVMVLGSFQCRGVLLLLQIVGQGPAVLAAGVGYIFYLSSFVLSCLLGDG